MAHRPNDTFHSVREQLQRQTQALIHQRNGLQVQRPSVTNFPPYRNIQASPLSHQPHDPAYRRGSAPVDNNRKAQIKNKIREIIDLCRDENAAVTRELTGVLDAERGVYGLLQQGDYQQARPANEPISVAPAQNYTPIRGQPQQYNPGKNLQKDIRSAIERNPHVQLSEQALQLIEEIERRALGEIQKLRQQKLAVVGQLNQQIRLHNAQKRRCAELERQLQFYRKGQGAGGAGDPRYENQLKARISYLQNLLQAQRQGNSPDFSALYAQGELIRQETLRLLKMKEARGYGQDEEKKRLREEVQRLQGRLEQLEQGENQRVRVSKPSYEVINEEYSPIAPSYKRKDSYRNTNSANQYESLVMEMRKITNN